MGAIMLRLLQGAASTMVQTTLYSICAFFYKRHSVEFIGYLQVMEGLGLAIGPPTGAFIYGIAGYNAVFNVCGVSLVISAIVFRFILSQNLA